MAEGIDNGSSNEEKVALFRELFFGRQDAYARRFENAKSGRSGYSPECANKWKRGVCGLPHMKCGQCGNRQFAPITDEVVRAHLRGRDMDGKPFVRRDTRWPPRSISAFMRSWRSSRRISSLTL